MVTLKDGQLFGNDKLLCLRSGTTVPHDARRLLARFEFQSDAGKWAVRDLGHRVRLRFDEVGKDYFCGSVYPDYESDAADLPQQILRELGTYAPLQGRLLDIGCAAGLLVKAALDRGLDAQGVDVSAWAIERANALTAGRCTRLDVDAATSGDFTDRFDFVVLHSVIEHVSDPQRLLNLAFQVAAPGAIVYIQTLNADSLMHRLLGDDWAGFTDYTHKSPWLTPDWLQDEADKIGFSVLSIRRDGLWNENLDDPAWHAFANYLRILPAAMLLEDRFGDVATLILQRPTEPE